MAPEPLYLDDDAAAQCVEICDRIIDKFDDAIKMSYGLSKVSGFGGFDSAQQLQAGFQRKLCDAPDSVMNRLVQFREAVLVMQETFAANGRGFDDTEGEFAKAIAAITAADPL